MLIITEFMKPISISLRRDAKGHADLDIKNARLKNHRDLHGALDAGDDQITILYDVVIPMTLTFGRKLGLWLTGLRTALVVWQFAKLVRGTTRTMTVS